MISTAKGRDKKREIAIDADGVKHVGTCDSQEIVDISMEVGVCHVNVRFPADNLNLEFFNNDGRKILLVSGFFNDIE